jgi:hypothetical protein
MVTITSQTEMDCLSKMTQSSTYGVFYIGAQDIVQEGTWMWVTGPEAGTTMGYANWRSGEPNNGFGSVEEDCVIVHNGKENAIGWYDVPCNSAPYVVEYTSFGNELLSSP